MILLIGLLVSVIALGGCVMSQTGRAENPVRQQYRQQYLAQHPTLAPEIRQAISAREVIPGMTREQVMAAWGPPASCRRTYGEGARDTVCLYTDRATIIGGPTMYTDQRYKSVYFQRGVVVDWQWH